MIFLTDFADQAVVLPLVLIVAITLAVLGWWRGAAIWLAVVGTTFAAVLAMKLGFLACGPVFGPMDLRSPSGHTAAAAMVAGGLAALLSGRQRAALPAALLAAGIIGTSRIVLGFHSLPEVLAGGALGTIGALVLSRLTGVPPVRRPIPLLAVAGAVAVLLHGVRLPAEAAIQHASGGALDFVPACRAVSQ